MKIEVLYPEIANLYGDLENIDYLKKSYPETYYEIIEKLEKFNQSIFENC